MGFLQVSSPNANPGTYQQALQLTAPGSANSLSLHFSVIASGPHIIPS